METYECEMCGKIFKSETYERFCPKCTRLRGTNGYKIVAFIISVIGLIGGIVIGNFTASDYADFNYYTMLYSWGSVFLFDIFVMAIHSICYRLDLIIDKKE